METFHHPHSPLATIWQVTIGKKLHKLRRSKVHSNPRSVHLLPVEDPHRDGEGRPRQAVLGPTAHGHQRSQLLEPPLEQLLQEMPQWHTSRHQVQLLGHRQLVGQVVENNALFHLAVHLLLEKVCQVEPMQAQTPSI